VGAIVLLNGIADASALAMSLAEAGRHLVEAAGPQVHPSAPAPVDMAPLLGFYAPPDMSFLIKLEWRDSQLTLIDSDEPSEKVRLERGSEAGTFVVAPGFRQSGEPVEFHRSADESIVSLAFGGARLTRLGPVG
jgi:hypothetical protein